MTEKQKLLTRYLKCLNTPTICGLFIIGCLQTDEMVVEMFRYIAEHPEAEYHELYEFTCKIAKREGLI